MWAMVKPGGSHMTVFFVSFLLLLICNQSRKIDYNEIKGRISSMYCNGYCERIHPSASWTCCGKPNNIYEDRKADCERKSNKHNPPFITHSFVKGVRLLFAETFDFVPGHAMIDATHRKQNDALTLLKRIRKFSVTQHIGSRVDVHIFNKIGFVIAKGVKAELAMAEKDAFLVDYVEGGLCVDYTDARIAERCNSENNTNRVKWENDDYICRGHKLNGMSNSCFDIYTNVESAKELWDSLESKYMAEDSSSKKFPVSNFNNYKMVDSRPVMEQYNELIRILGQYTQHGLKMDESISVSSIIDKLPPSWKDFKHTLKHGKDDLSMVQLGSHLRIEESLRVQDSNKGKGKEVGGPSVNMTEDGGKNKHHKQNKGKKRSNENNSGSRSNKKPKMNVGSVVRLVTSKGIAEVVDAFAWWIDSSATTHVCKDFCWFKTYEPVEYGSVLYMGDDHFAHVHGKGSVALEFSFGKTITLFNVLYVPKLRKNLVSGPMLNKCGYKQVYESDKYILSKSGVFVGFGYYNNGMFMLNLSKVPDDSNFIYMSSSTVVNTSLWHARLGHVHYKRMLKMSKDNLIPSIDENLDKCTTCMLTKITRQPFKSITRKSDILELIHSGLCDFYATPSLGNTKYIITFIDDAYRFCYVYLLHAKDEALDKLRIYKTEVELQQNDWIKTLCTDRGGEYYVPVFFQSVGVIYETTTPYTPRQNGVAERKNRALKEMVNSMLSYSGLSEGFWGEAMLTACYLLNRIPNKRNKTTPYELWYKKRPNLPFLRVWGCRAVVRLPDPKRETLGEKEAIDDEIGSIMENNTWVQSDLPTGCKPLGCKWIYKRNMKVDETVDKFKAQLVIQGFRQKEGIDYFDTYAPVVRITTIRLLLALASIHNLVIHQMDVKTAFLNGDLDEKVYMKQPKRIIMPENKGIVITQSYYIEKILKKFNREDCSTVSTPMDPVEKLKPNTGKPVDQLEYSRAIGCLMYAMTSTRPDIAYVVGRLNASWINHVDDSSFTSGWVFLLGGGVISWASKKQTYTTGSTMESKFVALAAAGKEAEWLRNLIYDILIWPKPIAPISIRCDSAPTMARAYSQIYNGKSRHLGVRHSIVRELIRNGVISNEFVQTQHNLADHLTKGLARNLLNSMWKAHSQRLEHVYLSSREGLTVAANSRSLFDRMMLYFKRETSIDFDFAADLYNLWVQFIDRTNDRKLFISELNGLPPSVMSYNYCRFLHQVQENDFIKSLELRKMTDETYIEFHKKLDFVSVMKNMVNEHNLLIAELNVFGGLLALQCAEFFKQLSQTKVLKMLEIRKSIAKEKCLSGVGLCSFLDDFGSREFTIYEMTIGCSVWMVREQDSFLVIKLLGKVVQYNIISKILHEIYDCGSNLVDDNHDDNDDADDDDDDELLQQFQAKHNVYEFIQSFASV
nr:zinc finger, CCHC-type [Tanacetum cinerariifolium]